MSKNIFFHWTNGDAYVGDWRDGVPHGHGEFVHGTQGLQNYTFYDFLILFIL